MGDCPREGHSNVKTARKATGNHLGYFPKTWFPSMAALKMACNCGRCSPTSTAACQVMGVIDLLLWTAEYQEKKKKKKKGDCTARKKQRESFEIFQKYFTKYFMKHFTPKNFMKFYITTCTCEGLRRIFGPGRRAPSSSSCCCYQFSKGSVNTQRSATKLCIHIRADIPYRSAVLYFHLFSN